SGKSQIHPQSIPIFSAPPGSTRGIAPATEFANIAAVSQCLLVARRRRDSILKRVITPAGGASAACHPPPRIHCDPKHHVAFPGQSVVVLPSQNPAARRSHGPPNFSGLPALDDLGS